MELLPFFSSQSFQTIFCFFFFSFTFSFTIMSLLLFLARAKLCCNCEICQSFISSSWSSGYNNLCDWYTHLMRTSPTGTIHVHVLNNTITSNPENVEYILKTNFNNYPKGKPFSTLLGDLLGNGIFNVDGDSWRFQRKMSSLELGSVSIRSYAYEIVTSEIQWRLIPLLSSVVGKQNEVVDLQDVLRRFSFDSICRFSFGLDPNCLNFSRPPSDFAMAFDLASRLSAERALCVTPLVWKFKRLFNLGSEKMLKEAIKVVNLLAGEVIDHRRKKGFSAQQDLLSRFMGSIDDDKYLRDIIVSFLLAGRDTIASSLTSFFHLLSNHPEVEAMIREESDKIMGTQTQDLASFDQVRQMHYLQAVVHESMRLYPPVQFDSKFCLEDDYLPDGTFVQKGTRVTYHPYAMGRMERIWGPDCLEFKPERWLKNGVFSQESPFKYPVFQAGVRVCLGKELALVEMKIIALSLVRRFNIRLAKPSVGPKFAPGLTATMSGGLPVVIKKRR